MDKVDNKDLEKVSGGIDFEPHFEPIFKPDEPIIKPDGPRRWEEPCPFLNKGIAPCDLPDKGYLRQCNDCSRNHD